MKRGRLPPTTADGEETRDLPGEWNRATVVIGNQISDTSVRLMTRDENMIVQILTSLAGTEANAEMEAAVVDLAAEVMTLSAT